MKEAKELKIESEIAQNVARLIYEKAREKAESVTYKYNNGEAGMNCILESDLAEICQLESLLDKDPLVEDREINADGWKEFDKILDNAPPEFFEALEDKEIKPDGYILWDIDHKSFYHKEFYESLDDAHESAGLDENLKIRPVKLQFLDTPSPKDPEVEDKELADRLRKFASEMKDLDPEFSKIVDKHFWDLLA